MAWMSSFLCAPCRPLKPAGRRELVQRLAQTDEWAGVAPVAAGLAVAIDYQYLGIGLVQQSVDQGHHRATGADNQLIRVDRACFHQAYPPARRVDHSADGG
jgi:hypothetical protein